jgi:hypothetical protein
MLFAQKVNKESSEEEGRTLLASLLKSFVMQEKNHNMMWRDKIYGRFLGA